MMADRPGGGHRFLVAALQKHLPAGPTPGPVAALGGLLDVLGHCHYRVRVVPHLLGRG